MVAIKKFKESDDNERVRKTALREVRILKVRSTRPEAEAKTSCAESFPASTMFSLSRHTFTATEA